MTVTFDLSLHFKNYNPFWSVSDRFCFEFSFGSAVLFILQNQGGGLLAFMCGWAQIQLLRLSKTQLMVAVTHHGIIQGVSLL